MRILRTATPVVLAFAVAAACSASGDPAVRQPAAGGSAGTTDGGGGTGTGGTAAGSAGTGGTAGTSAGGTAGAGGVGINTDAAGGTGGAAGSPGVGGAGVGGSGVGGCGEPPPGDTPVPEVCGDGLDNDLNGFVDEKCGCAQLGITQPCFGGFPSQANHMLCQKGVQTCSGSAEFKDWGPCENWQCGSAPPPEEVCDNGVDDNCNGLVDEGCALNVNVMINGDCLFAACPPQAPYAIGCSITFDGGDGRGCVSTAAGNGQVYFQEGDACCLPPPFNFDCGNVMGTLLCSSKPGPGLNDINCPMNKQQALYPSSGGAPRWGCP